FDALFDSLAVGTMSLLLLWGLAIESIVTDRSASASVQAVWAAYPVADAILLALVARTLAKRRTRAAIGLPFATGVLCWLAGDLGFLLLTADPATDRWLDMGWMIGAILFAQACWRRVDPDAEPATHPPEAGSVLGQSGIAIALLPLCIPGGLELLGYLRGDEQNPIPGLLATAVLIAVAFVRTSRLFHSEQRARAEARSSRRHYERLAANSSDAVILVDAAARIMNESPQLAALCGHPGQSTVGVDPMQIVDRVDADVVNDAFARSTTSPGEVISIEVRVRRADGSRIWLSARLVNLFDDPDVGGIIVNLHDITDRKRAEDELSHQAFHDPLTGLANRALFRDRLEHAQQRLARLGEDPVVVYLDLDGFKNVNDGLGHEAGDDLLRVVAVRLLGAVRTGDTVARLGGDEFAILIEASAHAVDEATTLADRCLQALSAPIKLGDQTAKISASIGIAIGDPDATSTSLLRNADVAMYRAKTSGKAQWILFDPIMRAAADERLQLETDLARALELHELRVVYQPVVELQGQHIVGFEALARWDHPTLGLIPPDKFIPIAEENGLIVPIGEWVLKTACLVGARWQRDYPTTPGLTMAVNLSARQLASPDLVVAVAEALAHSGLAPSGLVLEMTETALIQDAPVAAARLHELHDIGVRLAIDDFGTGYSSLSYLRQFPIDILKIDRSFVNTITDRTQIPAIVRGLLDLGRTLELEMVAEGVEDEVQLEGLRDQNCGYAQGFLFARPLDAVDAELLLTQMTVTVD
ncbi:MAG: hypothetical protein QOE63_1884, partial [Acidimicrobiaceae bacterium]